MVIHKKAIIYLAILICIFSFAYFYLQFSSNNKIITDTSIAKVANSTSKLTSKDKAKTETFSISSSKSSSQFTISGSVIDQSNIPIKNFKIAASLISSNSENEPSLIQKKITNSDGHFSFDNLPDGIYELSSKHNYFYLDSRLVVENVNEMITFIAHKKQILTLQGRVIDASDTPLSDVKVVTYNNPELNIKTDEDGLFYIPVTTNEFQSNYFIVLQNEGYQEHQVGVDLSGTINNYIPPVTIVLKKEITITNVNGMVKDIQGFPITNERVNLYSKSLNRTYKSKTNLDGTFIFEQLISASDYRLWIHPEGAYKDYIQTNVKIISNDEFLDIDLNNLELGHLSGELIDSEGNVVVDKTFQISSSSNSSFRDEVTSDSAGFFRINNLPEGLVTLKSTAPYITVQEIKIIADQVTHISAVIDIGNETLEGTVTDTFGSLIAGANVRIDHYSENDLQLSRSSRVEVTKESGQFVFSGLGTNERKITIYAQGYAPFNSIINKDTKFLNVELTKPSINSIL